MIIGVSYAGKPADNTAMYITKKVAYLINNLETVVGCKVFIESSIDIPDEFKGKNEFIHTDTPQRDYALFVQRLNDERVAENRKRKYTLTKDGFTIGENVIIGEGSYIEPGVFIDHDVIIGKNASIKSGAKLRNTQIGNNFIACENCTIGTNGFTMTEDEYGSKIRIPTLGKIIIGNNVEINSLTNISCGSAGNTIIEDNVKIDSLVHIGHDIHIGKNVEITAGSIIGGFSDIGDKSFVGINSTIKNRKKIGKNSIVGMGSVVTKDIEDKIVVAGVPAKKIRDNK